MKYAWKEITNVCQEENCRWPILLRDKTPRVSSVEPTPNAVEVTQYLMH